MGCGNGRNALYFAKKYPCSVLLVDSDDKMLSWAAELFKTNGLTNVASVHSSIEKIAGNPSIVPDIAAGKFDVVILSYVLQHIDPVYYPLVLDFCRHVCCSYLVIDVFWNPSRVGPGEFQMIGSVNWYGLTYEELVTMLAPNFSIVSNRLLKNDIAVLMNVVLKEGKTPLVSVLERHCEYYSGRQRRCSSTSTRVLRKKINIDELECVKLLNPFYSGEFDLVRTEMTRWNISSGRIKPSLLAAKFLWLCRINKIPVTFKEVARDFGITTGKLMEIMSGEEYVPALGAEDYIVRLSRQLCLSNAIRDAAKDMVGKTLGGTSPTVRACCAVMKAAEANGPNIKKSHVGLALGVSNVAINMALKHEADSYTNNVSFDTERLVYKGKEMIEMRGGPEGAETDCKERFRRFSVEYF